MLDIFPDEDQQIAIIGCGWLGLPLAQQLIGSGHNVIGTTRTQAKLESLARYDIEALPLELGLLKTETMSRLGDCPKWVVNIPPGRRTVKPEVFTAQMLELITHAKSGAIEHLIFISTTSVYGDQTGNLTEDAKLQPITPSAVAHHKIEQFIGDHLSSQSSILRLAGLVDSERHPVNFLAGKKDLSGANQAVNLIYKQDVCDAIERLIGLGPQAKPLHLAATEHPTRQNYYQWAAKRLGLVKPEFEVDPGSATKGKQIDATETLSKLGLELKYSSPFQMLD